MALRRYITKRLYNLAPSLQGAVVEPTPTPATSTAASRGIFRRFLQRRSINSPALLPEFLTLPVGDKLRERLMGINIAGPDGLVSPAPEPERTGFSGDGGLTVEEARRFLKVAQMERVKARLRAVPSNSVSYTEFTRICMDACEHEAQGLEFAKLLDEGGNVIVLGSVVFVRPEQVAKSMESLISKTIVMPNDHRKQELEKMEREKAEIDQNAQIQVRQELYCGLGLLLLQTLGFMRLTFWELSWDVMEPICFFVTSLYFVLAYAFFLRTSTEPSFEGYFHRRFKTKQTKLMMARNFDVEKYNQLRKTYPNSSNHLSTLEYSLTYL